MATRAPNPTSVLQEALPINSILHGDCIEILRSIPDKSVDLIFADPPYNLQLQDAIWRPNMTLMDGVDDEWDQFSDFTSYDEFTRSWLIECQRVLKDTGTIWVIGTYHNIYRVGTIMMDLGYWILNDVLWIKVNPAPNFRGVRFTNAHETLLWCKKSKGQKGYTFNYHQMKGLNDDKQMRNDWLIPICSGTERLKINGEKAHTTQKPEALLYRIILSSSNPGDLILDPFFGTGTTGAVAKKLHRNWIGIERDLTYIEVAQSRIESVKKPLFFEDTFLFETKRSASKIPFGNLVEQGFIDVNTPLYFARKGKGNTIKVNPDGSANTPTALVRADGSIKSGDIIGSIHSVAAQIAGVATCNGWELWYVQDKDGNFKPIDEFRDKMRKLLGQSQSESTNPDSFTDFVQGNLL